MNKKIHKLTLVLILFVMVLPSALALNPYVEQVFIPSQRAIELALYTYNVTQYTPMYEPLNLRQHPDGSQWNYDIRIGNHLVTGYVYNGNTLAPINLSWSDADCAHPSAPSLGNYYLIGCQVQPVLTYTANGNPTVNQYTADDFLYMQVVTTLNRLAQNKARSQINVPELPGGNI